MFSAQTVSASLQGSVRKPWSPMFCCNMLHVQNSIESNKSKRVLNCLYLIFHLELLYKRIFMTTSQLSDGIYQPQQYVSSAQTANSSPSSRYSTTRILLQKGGLIRQLENVLKCYYMRGPPSEKSLLSFYRDHRLDLFTQYVHEL